MKNTKTLYLLETNDMDDEILMFTYNSFKIINKEQLKNVYLDYISSLDDDDDISNFNDWIWDLERISMLKVIDNIDKFESELIDKFYKNNYDESNKEIYGYLQLICECEIDDAMIRFEKKEIKIPPTIYQIIEKITDENDEEFNDIYDEYMNDYILEITCFLIELKQIKANSNHNYLLFDF